MPGVPLDGIDKLKTSVKNIFKRRNKQSISQSSPKVDSPPTATHADPITTTTSKAPVLPPIASTTQSRDSQLSPKTPHEKDASIPATTPNIEITPASAVTEHPADESVLPLTDKKELEEAGATPNDPVTAPVTAPATHDTTTSEASAATAEVKREQIPTIAHKAEADKAGEVVAPPLSSAAQAPSDPSCPVMSATSGPLDDHPAL